MNVYVLIREGKGVDISGRFCCTHKKIQRGDTVTDRFNIEYSVDNIVIHKGEPDELIYLHTSIPRTFPTGLRPEDIH